MNYILLGHGCDLVDKEKRPVVINIKKGNVYITTTQCGKINGSDIWGGTLFNLQNNPDTTLFKEVLDTSLSDENTYHVCDGKTKIDFVDNRFTPMVDVTSSDITKEFMLYRSGLIPVPFIKTHKDIVYELFPNYYGAILFFYDINTNETSRTDDLTIKYRDKPLETLVEMAYNGSVYPSVKDVMQLFHTYSLDEEPNKEVKTQNFIAFKKEVKKAFKIPISELFKRFSGTYFNTTCRSICGSTNEDDNLNESEFVKLRRTYSLKKKGGNNIKKSYRKKTLRKRKTFRLRKRKTFRKRKILKKKRV